MSMNPVVSQIIKPPSQWLKEIAAKAKQDVLNGTAENAQFGQRCMSPEKNVAAAMARSEVLEDGSRWYGLGWIPEVGTFVDSEA